MLIHMDGCDLYASSGNLAYQYSAFTCGIITNGGRFGQGAIYISGRTQYLEYTFQTNQSEIWMGVAINSQLTGSAIQLIGFNSVAGIEASIYYAQQSGTWLVYKGNEHTLLGSATKCMNYNNYHWIEIHYLINPSSGIIEIWVDNTQIINLTSANTTVSGNTSFSNIIIGNFGGSTAMAGYYDDLYILNTSGSYNNVRLGDSRIQTLVPNVDVGPNDGTFSTGSTYHGVVNAAQNNGGLTYITMTNTPGQENLFGVTTLNSVAASVYAVKVTNLAETSDLISPTNVQSIIVSNAIVANGNVFNLNTTFSTVTGLFETDPSTSMPWIYTSINSANVGIIVT